MPSKKWRWLIARTGVPSASRIRFDAIAYLSFVWGRSTIQVHVAKPLVAKKDFSVRTQHLHVSIEQKARLRMTVIVLVQEEATVRCEVEQTLDCLQVFDFGVVKLIV